MPGTDAQRTLRPARPPAPATGNTGVDCRCRGFLAGRAACGDAVFNIDWGRWLRDSSDWNEAKRFWLEQATLSILEALKDLPRLCCDSVLFDEYAASERPGLVSEETLQRLLRAPASNLVTELVRLNSGPVALEERVRRRQNIDKIDWDDLWEDVVKEMDRTEREKMAGKRPRRRRTE